MKQPIVTQRLSLIAAILCGAGMLFQFLTFFIVPAIRHEQASPAVFVLMSVYVCLHVPFLILSFLAWRREQLTRGFSLVTVLGSSGLYLLVGFIAEPLLNTLSFRILASASAVGTFAWIRTYSSFFSVLYIAALVLLCCAGAIGLYSTSNQISPPSDGGKEELS